MRKRDCNFIGKRVRNNETRFIGRWAGESQLIHEEKEEKSERRMPRLPEAKKDVVSCDKARGSANRI